MITSDFRHSRFWMRLNPTPRDPVIFADPFEEAANGLEVYDRIDSRPVVKEMITLRMKALETAIRDFYACGVTLDRMEIQEHPGETRLCVDGTPHFTFRITFNGDETFVH